jgi:phenylacetate-CoA ligase
LKILLDAAEKAGKDASSVKRGPCLRRRRCRPRCARSWAERGVAVKQCYAVAEAGVISYESDALEGMILNEDMILEIVRPGHRRSGRRTARSARSSSPRSIRTIR